MNSYNSINYKLRPQKRIERALMVQLINGFSQLIDNKKINYIGMGSLYFADFLYFNRFCSIDKMVSIEAMTDDKGIRLEGDAYDLKLKRFLNNKPLEKIHLVPKYVNDAVKDNDLPLDENNFIWYDYDGFFRTGIINDLSDTIRRVSKSNLIAISFNSRANPQYISKYEWGPEKCRKSYLEYIIDKDPESFFDSKDRYSTDALEITETYLHKIVEEKNEENHVRFSLIKICTFEYQDNAKMTTVIWLLKDDDEISDAELTRYKSVLYCFNTKEKMDAIAVQEGILDTAPAETAIDVGALEEAATAVEVPEEAAIDVGALEEAAVEAPAEATLEGIKEDEIVIDLSMEVMTLYEKMTLDRRRNIDIEELSKEMGISKETINRYYKYAKYIPEYSEILF